MKHLIIFFVMLILCSTAAMAGIYNALKFDGSKDYVDVPYQAALNPSGDFTVELWARVDGGQNTRRNALSSIQAGSFDGYTFIAAPDNTWQFAWTGSTAYGPSLIVGAWTHLAAVHDGTQFKFYVNGSLVSTADGSGYVVNPSDDFFLGCDNLSGLQHWFNGAIADVRVWNVARSASDIQSNMYTTLTGSESGLVALWKFNEGGTTATDATSNHYVGTLTNFNFDVTDGWINTVLVIKSTQSGAWASTTTWVNSIVPISTDNVIIAAGHTVGLPSAGVTCNNLDVSGTLNPNQNLVTITGAFTVENGGAIIVGATTYAGSYSNDPTLNSGSIVRYNNPSATIKSSFTYSNLQLMNNCTGTADGDLTVNGTLTIQSGSALLPLSATSIIGGSGTLTGGGNVCVKHTGSATDFAAQFPITTTILTGLTVGFEGSAPQNVDGLAYHGLTISNSSGATLNGTTTVSSTLTLWSGTLTNGTNLTLGNGATIVVAGGILSDVPTFGTTVNITYNNSGSPQTIATGNKEFPSTDILNDLGISNTSGVTLNRDLTVNGNLNFSTTNGCNLTIGSNNLTLKGNANPGVGHCVITDGSGVVVRYYCEWCLFWFSDWTCSREMELCPAYKSKRI